MNKTLIITSHVERIDNLSLNFDQYSRIICADGGYKISCQLGLKADILIGDYDSMEMPNIDGIIKLPMEKDLTDSEAAIDLAVSSGSTYIDILGGLGGRLDHEMGNLGILCKYNSQVSHMAIIDGQNYVFMISPGSKCIEKMNYRYLGVISYGGTAENVSIEGVKYPLKNYNLNNKTSLGVSNEICGKTASISFDKGILLIILSNDL